MTSTTETTETREVETTEAIDAMSSYGAAAYPVLVKLAHKVTAAIPGNLVDPYDVATDALMRAIESESGRLTLEAISNPTDARHFQKAVRNLTVITRSVAIDTARYLGIATRARGTHSVANDAAELWATAVETGNVKPENAPKTNSKGNAYRGRTSRESELVAEAIKSDGPVSDIDRDAMRSHLYQEVTAGNADMNVWKTLPAHNFPGLASAKRINEKTQHDSIRIVRERPLEDLLANTLRYSTEFADPAVSGDYDASLCSPISEPIDRQLFSTYFAANVDDYVSASGNALVRSIPTILARWSSHSVWVWANRYSEAAKQAESLANVASDQWQLDRSAAKVDKVAAKRSETAYRSALAKSDDATRLAQLAIQVSLVASKRPVLLSDLVSLSVFVGPDRSNYGKRDSVSGSRWDRTSILAMLGLPTDPNGRLARGLTAVVEQAAEAALLAATGTVGRRNERSMSSYRAEAIGRPEATETVWQGSTVRPSELGPIADPKCSLAGIPSQYRPVTMASIMLARVSVQVRGA